MTKNISLESKPYFNPSYIGLGDQLRQEREKVLNYLQSHILSQKKNDYSFAEIVNIIEDFKQKL